MYLTILPLRVEYQKFEKLKKPVESSYTVELNYLNLLHNERDRSLL